MRRGVSRRLLSPNARLRYLHLRLTWLTGAAAAGGGGGWRRRRRREARVTGYARMHAYRLVAAVEGGAYHGLCGETAAPCGHPRVHACVHAHTCTSMCMCACVCAHRWPYTCMQSTRRVCNPPAGNACSRGERARQTGRAICTCTGRGQSAISPGCRVQGTRAGDLCGSRVHPSVIRTTAEPTSDEPAGGRHIGG